MTESEVITVSIPSAEIISGLLSAHTEYKVEVTEFGRKCITAHRFDDFYRLNESLKISETPPLPAKQFFGSNDPRTVEERRPILENFLRFLINDERCLASEDVWKFLSIDKPAATAVRYLKNLDSLKNLSDIFSTSQNTGYILSHKSIIAKLVEENISDSAAIFGFSLAEKKGRKFLAELGGITKIVKSGNPRLIANLIDCGASDEIPSLLISALKAPGDFLGACFEAAALGVDIQVCVARLLWAGSSDVSELEMVKKAATLFPLIGRLIVSDSPVTKVAAALVLGSLSAGKLLDDGRDAKFRQSVGNLIHEISDHKEQLGCLIRSPAALARLARVVAGSAAGAALGAAVLRTEFSSVNFRLPVSALERSGVVAALEDALVACGEEISVPGLAEVVLQLRKQGALPTARVEIVDVENSLRKSIFQNFRHTREEVLSHSATLKDEQKRAEKLSSEIFINVESKTQAAIQAFHDAVRNLEISQVVIRASIAQSREELGKSEVGNFSDGEFPRPPAEELRAWASSAEIVHAMEAEILNLETEAQYSETLLREIEAETATLESAMAVARRRAVELETEIRSENATQNSEAGDPKREKQKLEDDLAEAEKKLNELRERNVAVSGNLQLARRRQTDIRVRGESTTSKHAVLDISVRGNLTQCYESWDEKFQIAKTAESHCLASEALLRSTATKLIPDERLARQALLDRIAALKAALTSVESELQ